MNYTEHRTRVPPANGWFPYWITEVTARLGAGRLLLFIGLHEQGNNAND
nr:MAG TPA: hypothetical protein [Caudoviricetes sp.]DAM83218.1 MAG TPA: hypothetical protein [Caudoviricetes sp.]DAO81008.1 MAG TPA: hypothetical protein [Bacteriophage sp.]DAQ34148.1 MAG TPA: hypothetical protein [Caudoviricetes sp.]